MRSFLSRLLVAPLVMACAGDAPDAPPPPDALVFDSPGGDEMLRLPLEGLELGLVEHPADDVWSYNPTFAEETGVVWAAPVDAHPIDGGLALTWDDGIAATLSVQPVGEGRWDLLLTPTAGANRIGFYRISVHGDEAEGFYGLGEFFDRPEHRGHRRELHVEIDLSLESGYNESHVPVPLVVGTTGWGFFVADDHMMLADVATEADDTVTFTVGTGLDSPAGLRMHAYTAAHPLDITHRYYETTGFPMLPAPWALGPLLWRDENTGQAEVEGDLQAMRDLDLAASGIWIDRPYASAVNSFDFHPDDYEDPQAMIDTAHDLGFRVGLWHTPYAEEATGPYHQQAVDNGYFVPEVPSIVLNFVNWGPLVDLTNPDAYAWWTDNVRIYTDMGIEGFKLDFAEDIIPHVGANRMVWRFHDGSDERTMHRQYQRLYHQVYRDALSGPDDGFLLCRAGAWGDQTIASIIWPGDIDGTLSFHGEDMGEYVSVGGVAAAVAASSGLGPAGYPFFGSDTGGYRHTPPDKETFTRWFQHTALSSVMQIGMSSSDVAWEPVRDWDEAMLDDYRFYTRLHLRLFPYLWTYARRIEQTGHPLQRPLGLAHPELGEHPAFDYMLGEHLLVAPVVRPGETTRRVILPEGRWIDWLDLDILEGGEHTVDARLSKIPFFLREGGIVPMLRPTIDTLAPVSDPQAVDSFDADAGVLHARVFPGGAPTEFVLYDGTVLSQRDDGDTVVLGYQPGDVFDQGVVFEVVGTGPEPVEVSRDTAGETTL